MRRKATRKISVSAIQCTVASKFIIKEESCIISGFVTLLNCWELFRAFGTKVTLKSVIEVIIQRIRQSAAKFLFQSDNIGYIYIVTCNKTGLIEKNKVQRLKNSGS